MSKSLLIIGAGGQGKVALDCALAMGTYGKISFMSNVQQETGTTLGFETLYERAYDRSQILEMFDEVFIGVGDNTSREALSFEYIRDGASIPTLIHPSAYVSQFASIGKGSIIMPHSTINSNATVGEGCIINTAAIVEHDCTIGCYSHLSPAVAIGGGVSIGARSWLCIGSVVADHISCDPDVILAANSTLLANTQGSGLYAGSPAIKKRR